jgi:hypothetical protein
VADKIVVSGSERDWRLSQVATDIAALAARTRAVTMLANANRSGFRDQGSGIGDQGSGIRDRGSGMITEARCNECLSTFSLNEPTRGTRPENGAQANDLLTVPSDIFPAS